ncbi:hypothetical protein [Saccharophagus degradans]|uniref:Uncharacterized protein n=1 Tax=Saccharophagus degradans (strain 2-40 / ATCC 43961 / DSM 17024) TaxID=203122 RepID=Q21ME7_SACD2|nr:hypothetical protein [Saccharophagus degradans]ABD80132.1 hypothetical protein Sde_0870 [Saccharophagus degradans 2-40]
MTASRLSAFFIHLAISAGIFVILSGIIYFYLYPGVLFTTDGGSQGIKIIAGVDLVIGPLLTLIIFNPKKDKLKQDLFVICFLQTALLIIGMHLVYNARPIAVIFSDGKYHTMSKASFDLHGLDYTVLDTHYFRPTYYIIPPLQDEDEAAKETFNQLTEGPIYLKVDRYLPYQDNWHHIKNAMLPEAKIKSFGLPEKILSDFWVLPFEGRYYQDYVLVNKSNGMPIRKLKTAL